MGKTTSIVLMTIAGLLATVGLSVGNTSDLLFSMVLLLYAIISQQWK